MLKPNNHALFKRLPALQWFLPEITRVIPASFADDFETLEGQLMPHFRELDAELLRLWSHRQKPGT